MSIEDEVSHDMTYRASSSMDSDTVVDSESKPRTLNCNFGISEIKVKSFGGGYGSDNNSNATSYYTRDSEILNRDKFGRSPPHFRYGSALFPEKEIDVNEIQLYDYVVYFDPSAYLYEDPPSIHGDGAWNGDMNTDGISGGIVIDMEIVMNGLTPDRILLYVNHNVVDLLECSVKIFRLDADDKLRVVVGSDHPCEDWCRMRQFGPNPTDIHPSFLSLWDDEYEVEDGDEISRIGERFMHEKFLPGYRSVVKDLRRKDRRFAYIFDDVVGLRPSSNDDCHIHPGVHTWNECPRNTLLTKEGLVPNVIAFMNKRTNNCPRNLSSIHSLIKEKIELLNRN